MKRRHKKSPLGWAVAKLRARPQRARGLAFKLLGPELGARVWKAACKAQVREGPKRVLDRDRTNERLRARFVVLALRIAERTDPSTGKAFTRELANPWLAATEGLSVRQTQRYLRALRRSGALRTFQAPAKALRERFAQKLDRLKYYLGPSGWAYASYQWYFALPSETRDTLLRWRAQGRHAPPSAVS